MIPLGYLPLHLALLFHGSVRCCFFCCVLHFGLCDPPTPTLPSLVFTKCNITKMCNINFDADRKKQHIGEWRAAAQDFLLGQTGSGFIFFVTYCNFYFLMFLLFSLLLLYNFSFLFFVFGGGLYHLKRKRDVYCFDCVKGLSSPSFSLFFCLISPEQLHNTQMERWELIPWCNIEFLHFRVFFSKLVIKL